MKHIINLFFIFLTACSSIQFDPKNSQILAPSTPESVKANPAPTDKWDQLKNNFSPAIGMKMDID